MKPVQTYGGHWAVEIEEGDPTGCPEWCGTNHVGEKLDAGEKIAHIRTVGFDLHVDSFKPERAGEARVDIWEQDGSDPTGPTITALDANDQELSVEGLTPIGAWNLAVALREAALRANPHIQLHEDNMPQGSVYRATLSYTVPLPAPTETRQGPRAVRAA